MASLATRISDLITAVGTDIKQLRTWITGSSSGSLTGLTTTDKTNLVSAINEVKASSSGAPPSATTVIPGIIEIATLAEVGTGTDAVRAVTPQGVKQERDAVKAEILGVGVPAALDTLDELAAALADDANFASSVTASLAGKQPLDADLTAISALASAANKLLYATGSGAWALADFTAFARTLLDDPDAPTALATLGAQPADGDLTAIAALVSAADKLPYATSSGTWNMATFTAAGRALVDDADAATQRATLAVYSTTEIGNPDTDLVALYTSAKA